MADPSQKIYQSWPSGPPTYQQANTDGHDITQSREWNYSLFDCCSPGTLSWDAFSGSCKLLPEAKCEKNMALKDPVVAIAAYQFGAAAVLWFKKRKRWNSEQDLSFLATRIRARCPIHKPLFFSEHKTDQGTGSPV
ncbi:hypothetical protein N7455_004046 [Penicillium solitum]|uniref:uncharacterized protein n=1 Tax=Penicillium solitum TaxID=60172 RepID=UPI0032C45B66|nr:hypothetical protein N7455_004046 [Penicillium solitum]